MSYSDYLKNTLRPLDIYELDSGIGCAELDALGAAMDGIKAGLDGTFTEMLPMTATNEGLSRYESLFPRCPRPADLNARRTALMTLIRMGECECSEQGLNNVLASCGIPAEVSETETKETVMVTFWDYHLEGEELAQAKRRVEAILPCHLEILYE